MIIIIPIGGSGERFKKKNYDIPKALIKVKEKEILFYLIDNLNITSKISYIYIPYNIEYVKYDFENLIKNRYSNYKFKFKVIDKQTRGAAETIKLALIDIKNKLDEGILCIDSDNFYETDIIKIWNGENCVFTFDSKCNESKFSYIIEGKIDNNIINIIEKEKISNYACCGAYGFKSYYELLKYCNKIIDNNITQKNEFYISGVIKEMLNNKINFTNKLIDNKFYFSLGTPEQLKKYGYSFLFDLDGTLVDTDKIYIKVWNKILKEYNLFCDETFFNSFIKGKSDVNFLTYLSFNITNDKLNEISNKKDRFFIEILENEESILYNGVLKFFDTIQNSKIGIVTSCNKKAAEYIINKYNLEKYINILLSSEDVDKHKPHPEPYIKASTILDICLNKCIIFEDSNSGYISAKKANPYKICMYYNGKNDFVKNLDNFYFDDYNSLDTMVLINNNKQPESNDIFNKIKETMEYLNIKNINKNIDSNIKAGYICDINKYNIVLSNNEKKSIILKTSNNDNELSKVAIKLDMYDNEIYFYKKLSEIVNIDIPKYYGSFILDGKKSIIMEDLYSLDGVFNINLNNNITILLSIVKNIFGLHNKYYFTCEDEVIIRMGKLKKIKEITYFKKLINKRFNKFIKKNMQILSLTEIKILKYIYNNFDVILDSSSSFPLSFCHGDLKSPNIFYKNNNEPYFLDWQYIHLNKGISDIAFLLVESLEFNEITSNLVLNYYYLLNSEKRDISYNNFMNDFKNSLCIFPFFVIIWFNSEDQDKLIDKSFPLKFMKNVLKYYKYYL